MRTEVLKINPESPEPAKVKKAAEVLRRGGIVAIPTETVYGLAVNAEDKKAIDKLYSVKGRIKGKPFTIQIANLSQLKGYIERLPDGLEAILKEFWPGPLTIIVNGKGSKVGLRMPDNKVALSIIKDTETPLAVTSANVSGKPPALSAEEVIQIFDGEIDMVVDDGQSSGGVESTILDCTVTPFKVLRNGPIQGLSPRGSDP